MKIMNEIEADKSGKVTRILCENGQAVDSDSHCSSSSETGSMFKKILIANRGEIACASSARAASWA
jgi:acetyl/propionyl-CoA carboxylase alpha subunit